MFNTKNYQTRYFSKTWQVALRKREIEKNNFRATGDIKKAKIFVKMVENITFHTELTNFVETMEYTIFPEDSIIPILQYSMLFLNELPINNRDADCAIGFF